MLRWPVLASSTIQNSIIGTCVAGPAAAMRANCRCELPHVATTASPPSGHSRMCEGEQPWRTASAMWPSSCTSTISTPSGPSETNTSAKAGPPARTSARSDERTGITKMSTCSRTGMRWPPQRCGSFSAPTPTVSGMSCLVAPPAEKGVTLVTGTPVTTGLPT